MSLHALVLAALCLPAQQSSAAPPPGSGVVSRLRWAIPGTVLDLARDSAGRILYCTEHEVGRIPVDSRPEVLATAASFPNELRAVAESGTDVVVVDVLGNVLRLPGGTSPPILVYQDRYMIQDPTDLIVDARGSFLIASTTATSGTRAINWIAADGVDWSYYRVGHQPLALAHDPLTGGILMSDASGSGTLRLVEPDNPIRPLTLLDATTQPGTSSAQGDGDLAVTAGGDVYWIAGGNLWLHRRATGSATGTTTLRARGFQQLRGVVIAATSPASTHGQPWSVYVAEGSSPTHIYEVEAAPAPADLVAEDQGDPPGKGLHVPVSFGCQCLDLTLGQGGRLLLGGTSFVSGEFLKKITTTGTPSIVTVATSTDGLLGPLEGVVVAPDRSIYTLAHGGSIQHVTTSPLSVTTVFTDPNDVVVAGKDLAMDVDGSLYVATRDGPSFGRIFQVSGGSAVQLLLTQETRGLAARPQGGMYFSQWRFHGFAGTVDLLRFPATGPDVDTLPGFAALNYSNDDARGDGEIVVDANGNVYTISEDDWSLVLYHADLGGIERIGSGYLGHPAGLAIGPSTDASGSATGWSLYVAESFDLWEHPGCPPPASPWVDASLGLSVERSLAGAPHPRYGRPTALAPAPHPDGLLIGTEGGWLLTLDTRTGTVLPVAGPEQGLHGELVAIGTSRDGLRTFVVNTDGQAFELVGTRALAAAPERTTALLARVRAEPQRTASLRDRSTGRTRHFALDGWVVWRVADER